MLNVKFLLLLLSLTSLLIINCFNKDMFKNQSKKSLIIVGCARDCDKYLPKVLNKIKELAKNKKVYFIFYENDSKDNTNIILHNFVNEINNKNNDNYKAHLITEKLNIKRRTPRIAHCRNQILKYIINNNLINQYDFYINMDLDNVNVNLNINSVNRCLNEVNKWDIASISQSKYYYDTWALRTNIKNDNSSGVLKDFNKWFIDIPEIKNLNRIPIEMSYIPVISAFGGFTIYKTNLLKNSWYSGIDKRYFKLDECEHVNFHESIFKNFPKTRFYIIPYMTND